eukprot:Anaeramoba_ignava/a1040_33.p1 GENE.a1040_33~~a1040_33.p1  ORF type:complete len:1229 (-),score=395.70 a1040_33:98-3706(-)
MKKFKKFKKKNKNLNLILTEEDLSEDENEFELMEINTDQKDSKKQVKQQKQVKLIEKQENSLNTSNLEKSCLSKLTRIQKRIDIFTNEDVSQDILLIGTQFYYLFTNFFKYDNMEIRMKIYQIVKNLLSNENIAKMAKMILVYPQINQEQRSIFDDGLLDSLESPHSFSQFLGSKLQELEIIINTQLICIRNEFVISRESTRNEIEQNRKARIQKANAQEKEEMQNIDREKTEFLISIDEKYEEILRQEKERYRNFLIKQAQEIHLNKVEYDLEKMHYLREIKGLDGKNKQWRLRFTEHPSRKKTVLISDFLDQEKKLTKKNKKKKKDKLRKYSEEMKESLFHKNMEVALGKSENWLFKYNCTRVFGLNFVNGLLIISQNQVFIVDNIGVDIAGKIVHLEPKPDFYWVMEKIFDTKYQDKDFQEFIQKYKKTNLKKENKRKELFEDELFDKRKSRIIGSKCVCLENEDINNVLKRNFSHQDIGLEIFTENGRSYFVCVNSSQREQIMEKILWNIKGRIRRPFPYSSVVDNYYDYNILGEMTQLGGYRDEKDIEIHTKMWQEGRITNFQYLMFLNTISERSFNNYSQYFVFPWILSEYETESLSIEDEKNYRDLSKPMGALTDARKNMFEERYQTWVDNSIPKFLYGTHYSAPLVILYYLIRLQPFTKDSIEIQGGKLDYPDRIFKSIKEEYISSSQASTSDVKELIPEFFYLPEFLVNKDHHDFGYKQMEHEKIDDCELPNWANSPEQFIRIHNEALESEIVSQNIHNWIDLIFGYKQQGEEAVKNYNTFYYLTYENLISFEKVETSQDKKAIEIQIEHFGQTPVQLLKKPHPKRFPREKIIKTMTRTSIYWRMKELNQVKTFTIKICDSPIIFIQVKRESGLVSFLGIPDKVVVINLERKLATYTFAIVNQKQMGNEKEAEEDKTNTPNSCFKFQNETQIRESNLAGISFLLDLQNLSNCFYSPEMSEILFSCGYWDNSFKITNLQTRECLQSMIWHRDIVTCLKFDGNFLVTGSKDTTLVVWDCNFVSGTKPFLDFPRNILCEHQDEVMCLDISQDLDMIVSGSCDGTCIIHTLRKPKFVRYLHKFSSSVTMIQIALNGNIVVYCQQDNKVSVFTINGKFLSHKVLDEKIQCWCLTSNSQFLIFGTNEGRVHFLFLDSLSVFTSFSVGEPIKSVTLTKDEQFLLIGSEEGNIHFVLFSFR